MFRAKTERLKLLARQYAARIHELDRVFDARTAMYIDYANVRPWATKLGWHIDLKRLKQLLDSFDAISAVKFYHGTLVGDEESERRIREAQALHYDVRTKPVKIMRLSVDISSIRSDSTDILKDFVRAPLLQQLRIEAVEYLNRQLAQLNTQGVRWLEDRKCNFDVEIGRDMLLDDQRNGAEHFVLWSGDSDFADPIHQLLQSGKRVTLFATARRVSTELNMLTQEGLVIFDIQKIRDFICWKREMRQSPP